MRLPNISTLQEMLPWDAENILDHHERELEYVLDPSTVIFDHRGASYHKGLARKKLKRITEIREAL